MIIPVMITLSVLPIKEEWIMNRWPSIAVIMVLTMVTLVAVLIMNGRSAVDCTAVSTWASPSVTHCIEGE